MRFILAACAMTLALGACATQRESEGVAAGAVGGALVGGPVGAVVGGVAGGLATEPGAPLDGHHYYRCRRIAADGSHYWGRCHS